MLPIISILPNSADERSDIVFRVTLSEPSLADVTVQYRAVQDGTVTVGRSDFVLNNAEDTRTLTIPAGQTQATIAYPIESTGDEVDENFTLELSNPTNAVLSGGGPVLQATGVVLDTGGGQDRALFVSDPVIFETDGSGQEAVFEIRLSEPFDQPVTLNYATADGTARAGQDYVAKSGSVTFAAGQTVASVAVGIVGDRVAETLETFSLIFSDVPSFIAAEDRVGIAAIQNDDSVTTPGPNPSPTPGPNPAPGPSDNRAPDARDDAGAGYATTNAAAFTTANVLSNDADPDGDAITILSLDLSDTQGSVTSNGNGTFRYDPDGAFDTIGRGQTAVDSFVYRISDGEGGTDSARVTVSVAGTKTLIEAPANGGTIVRGSNEDEVITGNSGNNILVGFGGEDVLTGLEGRDIFVLSAALGATPNVTITDFQDNDLLAVDDQLLGFGTAEIDVRPFTFAIFLDILASGRVGYNRSTGELRIDTDGDGALELVATLEGPPTLGIDDVLLF